MTPLGHKWTLTIKRPHPSGRRPTNNSAWYTTMAPAAMFDTVQHFWGVLDSLRPVSKMPQNTDVFLFRDETAPLWEDVRNANGGRWTVAVPTAGAVAADDWWVETAMAAVGEQFGDTLCGVAASARKVECRVSVWTDSAADKEAVLRVGHVFRAAVGGKEVVYSAHTDTAVLHTL